MEGSYLNLSCRGIGLTEALGWSKRVREMVEVEGAKVMERARGSSEVVLMMNLRPSEG